MSIRLEDQLLNERIFSPRFLLFFLKFRDAKKAISVVHAWGMTKLEKAEEGLELLKEILLKASHVEYPPDCKDNRTFEKDLSDAIEELRQIVRELKEKSEQQESALRGQHVGYY